MHRIARALVVLVVVALSVGGVLTAVAGASKAEASKPVLATLKIEKADVEVKKKGASSFKAAEDGQKLREGDTVRTDATGLAEVDYSDDAYTRLDVNTTFTITKLTENQGARQVEGSLDTGRTWNRTEAVTESGSFEQSGAGATAAVAGTAFAMTCVDVAGPLPTDPVTHECSFLSAIHTIIVTSETGEVRVVPEHSECGSVAPGDAGGDLCDAPHELTLDELAAIDWIQHNLLKDLVERGLCCGPITQPLQVALNVQDGQVTSFAVVQQPPSTPTTSTTSTTNPTSNPTNPSNPPPAPPTIDANPVLIGPGGLGASDPLVTGGVEGANSQVVTEDEVTDLVTFVLTGTNPDGSAFYYVFTDLPAPEVGTLYANDVAVELGAHYAPDTVFTFDPVEIEPVCGSSEVAVGDPADSSCYTNGLPSEGPNAGIVGPYPTTVYDNGDGVYWKDSFTYKAVDTDTGAESAPKTVDVVVYDDICGEGAGANRPECQVLSDPPPPPGDVVANSAPSASDAAPNDASATDPPSTEETTATSAAG